MSMHGAGIYGRLGSATAEELGLVATGGVGSSETRLISWFHCAASSGFAVITGEAGEPADRETAPAGCVCALPVRDATGGVVARPKANRMRFQYAALAWVSAEPGYRIRLVISDGTNSLGRVSSVRIARSVMVLAPWWSAIGVPSIAVIATARMLFWGVAPEGTFGAQGRAPTLG